jgi:hypothetical protein
MSCDRSGSALLSDSKKDGRKAIPLKIGTMTLTLDTINNF